MVAKKIEEIEYKKECKCKCHSHYGHFGNVVYALGFVGAAIYYVETSTGFWMQVNTFIKSSVLAKYG